MYKVSDIAQYILECVGEITTVKLQKLVYYCQAWSLVWDEEPLFASRIEAWANGPVVPELFKLHQGYFKISAKAQLGDASNLSALAKDTIDNVLKGYADKHTQWLVDLTHLEEPWREARGNAKAGEKCNNEITLASMMNYYSGL